MVGQSLVTTPTTESGPVIIGEPVLTLEADLFFKFTECMLNMRYGISDTNLDYQIHHKDFGRYSNFRLISNDRNTLLNLQYVIPDLPSKIWDCPTVVDNPDLVNSVVHCSLKI